MINILIRLWRAFRYADTTYVKGKDGRMYHR